MAQHQINFYEIRQSAFKTTVRCKQNKILDRSGRYFFMKKTVKKFLPKIIGFKLNSLFLVRPNAAVHQAFQLFCGPRRGGIKPEQEVFLNAAKTKKITVDGKSLQLYHWKGSKETILLLHGWESNTHRWKQLIEKLQAESYNIVAFDAPAHGNSEGKLFNVPLYSKCVDMMVEKIQPDHIIGHSMGAMTTVYQQHFHPTNNIKKLILLGAPSELTLIMADFQKILNLTPKFMHALNVYFHTRFGFTFEEFSIASFAKTIKQKGLVFHDVYDKIAPVSSAKAIHANWTNSELIITEGAGHSLNNEAIHSEIVRFLKP